MKLNCYSLWFLVEKNHGLFYVLECHDDYSDAQISLEKCMVEERLKNRNDSEYLIVNNPQDLVELAYLHGKGIL